MQSEIPGGNAMQLIEELSMNALPALQTLLLDGWVIRLADGYTKRANSVNPVYASSGDVHQKIAECEALFRSVNLKPTYKIAPQTFPMNLDGILEGKGYSAVHPTSVQILDLSNLPEPSIHSVISDSEFNPLWFEHYCELNGVHSQNRTTFAKMLKNLVPEKFFTSLIHRNEIVGCGMAVMEKGYIGIYDITVQEKYRNCGYGYQMILNMLHEGMAKGAKQAYLQVVLNNPAALHLYAKLGFTEAYQYHYRVIH